MTGHFLFFTWKRPFLPRCIKSGWGGGAVTVRALPVVRTPRHQFIRRRDNMTMSAGRMLRLSTLAAVASVILAMPQDGGGDLLGLMKMKMHGCLPEDFRIPEDMADAVAECKAHTSCGHSRAARSHHGHGDPVKKMMKMMKIMQMLPQAVCTVDKLDLIDETGADVEEFKELLGSFSANETWTQHQKMCVDMCQKLMDPELTPTQQAVYMTTCYSKMAATECKMKNMVQMGGEQMKELVEMDKSQCFMMLKSKDKLKTGMAMMKCAKEVGLDMMEKPASKEDMMKDLSNMLEMVKKQKQMLICMMRETGEIEGDMVKYDRIKEMVSERVGPQCLKDLKLKLVEQCEAEGFTDAEEACDCWYDHAWKYCASAKAYMMAKAAQPDWVMQASTESTSEETDDDEEDMM